MGWETYDPSDGQDDDDIFATRMIVLAMFSMSGLIALYFYLQ